MTVTCNLAAILAADVTGYSRLMGSDEEGTLERLKAHRRELVDPNLVPSRLNCGNTSRIRSMTRVDDPGGAAPRPGCEAVNRKWPARSI